MLKITELKLVYTSFNYVIFYYFIIITGFLLNSSSPFFIFNVNMNDMFIYLDVSAKLHPLTLSNI